MEQSHILLIADTHSQVTFVQEDVSGSADLPGLHNGVVETLSQGWGSSDVSPGAELEPPPVGGEPSTCRALRQQSVTLGCGGFGESVALDSSERAAQ